MITEIAHLNIIPELQPEFEPAFKKASSIISNSKGYIEHELQKCLEKENHYLLIVRWETLEDHEIGFRQSEEYQEWKSILHKFYSPFPEVLHFKKISL